MLLCPIIMMHKGTSSSYTSVEWIRFYLLLSSEHLCLHGAIYIKIFLLHSLFYLLVS